MSVETRLLRIVEDLADRGWSIQEDFLPLAYVGELAQEARDLWHDGTFRRAGVGSGAGLELRPEIRTDHVLWLDPAALTPLQELYWQHLETLRLEVNRELFLGARELEAHFAVYPPGSFYKKHLDQFRTASHRLLSCILYLNDGWQPDDGGELRLYDGAEGTAWSDVLPRVGTFVCFRSDTIWHAVLPSRRERFSLTGWLRRSRDPSAP
jgi:SM-20-related protein